MLIVTDGAVDLPAPLEESPLLRIVPGAVWLKDEPFVGGVDEFWALLRRGAYPSTTPPAVDALVEAYGDTDAICAMHVSAELSSTVARCGRQHRCAVPTWRSSTHDRSASVPV